MVLEKLGILERYEIETPKSKELFGKALRHLPGGVSYAIRFFDPYPAYISRAMGSRVWDVDGNEYVDMWMGHGALVMGHGFEPVIEAAREQLESGTHIGYATEWEVRWAEKVCSMMPSVESVRPTNSGTEANMYCLRVARAYTKRTKVAKFEGGWHGGYDALLKAVNHPFDMKQSLGLSDNALNETITLPFNDLDGVREGIRGENLAAIVVEPVLGAGGFIPAEREFLKGLRELCDEGGILLIFDEVITGFRLSKGGAQEYYGVRPDLTVMGKIVGGGCFPAGAFGGRRDIMELLDHTKRRNFYERSFHGGTYAGNPLVMRAGYTMLSELGKEYAYPHINGLGEKARRELEEMLAERNVAAHVTGVGSLLAIHFVPEKPMDAKIANEGKNISMCREFFSFLLSKGIMYVGPHLPHFILSYAHSREEVDRLLNAVDEFFRLKGN